MASKCARTISRNRDYFCLGNGLDSVLGREVQIKTVFAARKYPEREFENNFKVLLRKCPHENFREREIKKL